MVLGSSPSGPTTGAEGPSPDVVDLNPAGAEHQKTRIPLNPQLLPLIELQKLDLRIADIKEQRRKVPEQLESAAAPLRNAKQALEAANSEADSLVKQRRSHEKDLDIQEDKIDKLKARASQLKTNQEYQAHLFEVDLANKKKGEIEDQILALMESIEQAQRTVKELNAKVIEAERVFKQEKSRLDELDGTLASELAQLDGAQQELAAKIDKTLLLRYTKLKAARKDHALAATRDGICTGCRLQVPPQLIAEVKRMQDLHTCPYCHRMLYWEGEPSTEASPAPTAEKNRNFEIGESV